MLTEVRIAGNFTNRKVGETPWRAGGGFGGAICTFSGLVFLAVPGFVLG